MTKVPTVDLTLKSLKVQMKIWFLDSDELNYTLGYLWEQITLRWKTTALGRSRAHEGHLDSVFVFPPGCSSPSPSTSPWSPLPSPHQMFPPAVLFASFSVSSILNLCLAFFLSLLPSFFLPHFSFSLLTYGIKEYLIFIDWCIYYLAWKIR